MSSNCGHTFSFIWENFSLNISLNTFFLFYHIGFLLWGNKTFKTFSAKSHCKSVLLGCCGLKTLLVSPAGRIDFCYCFNHLSIFMGPLRIFHRVSLVKQCWLDYVANVNRVHDISFLCGLYIFTCYLLSDWIFSNIFFHVTLVTGKIPWASEWIN